MARQGSSPISPGDRKRLRVCDPGEGTNDFFVSPVILDVFFVGVVVQRPLYVGDDRDCDSGVSSSTSGIPYAQGFCLGHVFQNITEYHYVILRELFVFPATDIC